MLFETTNLLIELGGGEVENLKLQKLVYICLGFSLALLDKPLFDNRVYAFPYGPIIPVLYNELKKYRAGKVKYIPTCDYIETNSPEYELITSVWNSYGTLSGLQLSTICHKAGSPWTMVKTYGIIPHYLIQRYYKKLLKIK